MNNSYSVLVSWFNREKSTPEAEVSTAESTPVKKGQTPKKGHATPKRSQAQARNTHQLVPTDRKAARKEERAKRDAAYDRQHQAMITGDERYLPARDKGPVRRYIRDYVDARFSLGEMFIPLSFLLLIVVIVAGYLTSNATVNLVILLSIYALFFIAILDAVYCWFRLRPLLKKKFPDALINWRLFFYTFGRCFQLRRWRLPKPQVARGHYPS